MKTMMVAKRGKALAALSPIYHGSFFAISMHLFYIQTKQLSNHFCTAQVIFNSLNVPKEEMPGTAEGIPIDLSELVYVEGGSSQSHSSSC